MGFFFKSKKKPEPDRWEEVAVFTQEQTLELCKLWDAYMNASTKRDHTEKHLFWSKVAEFYPESEHLPPGCCKINWEDPLHWKLKCLVKADA